MLKGKFALVLMLLAGLWIGSWLAWPGQAGTVRRSTALRSRVMTSNDARALTDQWGEMWTYFVGETFGTTNLFSAVVVVKPGESMHPVHRHAEEEFLVVTEGSGRWHLDGKEFPAQKGDVLYAAPWVFHGLVSTGATPLTFVVVKWNSKGVKPLITPRGDHGR